MNNPDNQSPTVMEAGDLLYGVPAIAAFLNLSDQQVYHLASAKKQSAEGRLPTFKWGKTIAMRKSTVTAWIKKKEDDALAFPHLQDDTQEEH